MSSPTTYVLGLGNVLMGDDGFGPAVVRAFEGEYVVGPEVETVDLGTPGLDLTPWLADARRVIIVDTVRSPAHAGTLRIYQKDDLTKHPPTSRTGPHDPGLKETLLTLEFAGRAPREVILVGVVPARVALGLELSPEVEEAVPKAVGAVVAALKRQGVPVRRRLVAAAPTSWWVH